MLCVQQARGCDHVLFCICVPPVRGMRGSGFALHARAHQGCVCVAPLWLCMCGCILHWMRVNAHVLTHPSTQFSLLSKQLRTEQSLIVLARVCGQIPLLMHQHLMSCVVWCRLQCCARRYTRVTRRQTSCVYEARASAQTFLCTVLICRVAVHATAACTVLFLFKTLHTGHSSRFCVAVVRSALPAYGGLCVGQDCCCTVSGCVDLTFGTRDLHVYIIILLQCCVIRVIQTL